MDKKLEQMFYALLGGALTMKEKVEASNEERKAWQEKSEEHARNFVEEMARRGEQEQAQLKEMFKKMFKEIVAELDLATRQDLEELKKDLEK
ncbi:MAG: hypothetical protein P8Y91_01615 [Desulfuromonadales bacterium]|jgi:polyhydroxyalkanoate synthesis regulator phasin